MNRFLQMPISYWKEHGIVLQRLVLPLSDFELRRFTPAPSQQIIYNLKKQALLLSFYLSGEIN
ncbi:MAG: hypothetical protein FWH18_11715 [Marinilabiliaceae bacterium]|nr:hypothetical protein [Marinilabiliaceae bacterium]